MGNVGQRLPGIWTNADYGLHVCMALNGSGNSCKNLPIQTNKWYGVTVSQKMNDKKEFEFRVLIDGTLSWQVLNKDAAQFENVKVFSSDPWHSAFDGRIR